ncbi:MAG TPA: prepilin-type N-terminal cleavage/methylation domain-containing protein [Myxococcaceae bacterium]|jgi:type IV pilus assembly protein PilV
MSPARLSVRGFSLIESMAALLVFTIGILGVMQMNVIASQQNNVARNRTNASKVARDLADAFERLPFNHPVFATMAPPTLQPTDPDFIKLDVAGGLFRLSNVAGAGGRPLLGAADAIATSEKLEVAWRVQGTPDPALPSINNSLRVAIMVRYPTPTGFGQVTMWVIKYNPDSIALGTGAAPGSLEI